MLSYYLSLLESPEEKARFNRLYDRYHRRFLRIARSMLPTQAVAEDAVHDAFVKIILHFEKISSIPRKNLDAYVVTILKNTVLDQLRRDSRHPSADWATVSYALPDVRQDPEVDSGYRLLLDAIELLPPQDRALLERKLVLGWSDREIARELGLAANTVAVRFLRARERLKKLLIEEGIV